MIYVNENCTKQSRLHHNDTIQMQAEVSLNRSHLNKPVNSSFLVSQPLKHNSSTHSIPINGGYTNKANNSLSHQNRDNIQESQPYSFNHSSDITFVSQLSYALSFRHFQYSNFSL